MPAGRQQMTCPRIALESAEATPETKARLEAEKGRLNPFALKREIEAGLREIARLRRLEA